MTRPTDMPPAESFAHGTRARYVSKCRCDACRAANTRYVADRAARAKAAAAERVPAAAIAVAQLWTAPDGTKRPRVYKRACRGVDGAGCPTQSHLRRDSTGDVCCHCRETLIADPLVPAARAQAHLLALSALGVGRRSVVAACDVGDTTLAEVRAGRQLQIRRTTERRILEVDAGALADHAVVDASTTWRQLTELLELGITKTRLARELGAAARMPALQVGRQRVLVRTAHEVARLHRQIAAQLLRAQELRDEFALAAEAGRGEHFDHAAFSFFKRAVTPATSPALKKPKVSTKGTFLWRGKRRPIAQERAS